MTNLEKEPKREECVKLITLTDGDNFPTEIISIRKIEDIYFVLRYIECIDKFDVIESFPA